MRIPNIDYFKDFHDIHPELLTVIVGDAGRNKLIVDAVASPLPSSLAIVRMLCRTCDSLITNAASHGHLIDGNYRRNTTFYAKSCYRAIPAKGDCVITNFGVLTTGFDAPAIDTVIVARPTASSVLYEQMIGRGMRGPEFGGTERCLIIDVEDNLRFQGQMAARRHRDIWLNR